VTFPETMRLVGVAAGHDRSVRAESHMMFTPPGLAAFRITPSDPSATTGLEVDAHREHKSPVAGDPTPTERGS
jgi:hypothetical protein